MSRNMLFIAPLFASLYPITSVASAVPSSSSPSTDIKFIYRWESNDSKEGLFAFDPSDSLLAFSCGNAITTGQFTNSPISIKLNPSEPSQSRVLIGSAEYPIQWEQSGGAGYPRCGMAYNEDFVEILCYTPIASKQDAPLTNTDLSGQCLGSSSASTNVVKGISLADTGRAAPVQNATIPEHHVDATQRRDTVPLQPGDGNPYQRAWHAQVTENNDCGANTCSVGISKSTANTWNFMASVTPFRWITAGFNVGQSYTTSQQFTCDGNAGQRVCVWHNEAYTGYMVANEVTVCSQFGCGTQTDSKFLLNSPNTVQPDGGQNYYCVINTCRSEGQAYWVDGAKGAPPG